MKVPIAISGRHVHLTKEHLEVLFGDNHSLKVFRDLKQKGQFASTDFVSLKGPKGVIDNVRLLGPIRSYSQVEISKTDAHLLGINPPVRSSGDLKGSSQITLIGPKGELTLKEGAIIATRHIHMNFDDAKVLGLQKDDVVKVKVEGIKGGIMDNVLITISDSYFFELHIDCDDANAFLIKQGDYGTIIKS